MRFLLAIARLSLVAAIGAGAGLFAASPAHAATGATLVRLPTAPNAAGYGLEITAAYDTNAPTTSWQLSFDLPPTTMPNPWSGLPFSRSGNRWTLNYLSSSPQRAGTTTLVLVTMMGTANPENCSINGNPCVYIVRTDTVPPTTPGNVTATRYSGMSPWGPYASVYLTWGASTDNYRLAGYEIAANGQVVTTTEVSVSYMHLAYTTQQVTYTVRAFDSVGNYSAAGTVALPAI
jgi:hypothetical protein